MSGSCYVGKIWEVVFNLDLGVRKCFLEEVMFLLRFLCS